MHLTLMCEHINVHIFFNWYLSGMLERLVFILKIIYTDAWTSIGFEQCYSNMSYQNQCRGLMPAGN